MLIISKDLFRKTIFAFLLCLSFLCPAYATEKKPAEVMQISLQECILLAIRNNISIKSAYLDRITQKFSLKVAEDKFVPKLNIIPEVVRSSSTSGDIRNLSTRHSVTAVLTQELPTGGNVNLSTYSDLSSTGTNKWAVTLNQPLLKGFGFDVSTAPVKIAQLNEQINILSLKSTLMDIITSVIVEYRNYMQSLRQVEISRESLKRARELFEINKELISAGRMAAVELVQTEADVASKEFDLLQTENNADRARLSLLKILDLNKATQIVPDAQLTSEPTNFDVQTVRNIAFQNRPDYLISQLNKEIANINLITAKNNMYWDLSLTGTYGQSYTKNLSDTDNNNLRDWSVGLRLTIPLRDLTLKQGYINAKVSLDKSELNIKSLIENIEIEVQDAVRDIQMKSRQLKLAGQSKRLSEQKLEIEMEKMKAGRSSNFQLVTFQNDLVNAQNNELNAIVNYLNAIANLEKTIGITLDRWGIKIEQRYEDDYLK